ncbi:glycosyltransferase family 2 protein [Herbihabitans rhizosphaerae]|uniref:glycosyltransferase family 2 protein n=1 Tax=Herbihabitans rhizosphaerae TaxID=1872711 RepID=UPI003BF88D07
MTATLSSAVLVVLLFWWPAHNLALAAFAWRTPRPRRVARETADPLLFWIMIPALNEERVIANTVRSALSLGTEATPVRVLVIDDGSDDGTQQVLSTLDDSRLHVLRRNAPEARQGKGEALNAGYRYIEEIARAGGTVHTTVVGVIDGDGRGSTGMLAEIAALMADRSVGAVQCRVRIHNRRKVLALLQDLEFATIADASQSLRDLVGSVGMGGNGQFTRLSVLVAFDPAPWSQCLVEDLELGLRLHLSGYRVRYTKRAWVTQQGLEDLRRLLRQRARWAQGNLQCVRHLRPLIGSRFIGSVGLLDFLVYLVVPWLTVPLSLLAVGLLVVMAAGALNGTVAAVWLGVLLLPGLIWAVVHRLRLADEPLHRCLLAGLLYPGFLLLGVVSTWRALFRVITRRNSWAKTERLSDDVVPA